METGLPGDPVLLMSVVNTKLRDYYHTLDELCEDLGADKEEIIRKLEKAGFVYDDTRGQFG